MKLKIIFLMCQPWTALGESFSEQFQFALENIDYGLLLDQTFKPTLTVSHRDVELDLGLFSLAEIANTKTVIIVNHTLERHEENDTELRVMTFEDMATELNDLTTCIHKGRYIKDPSRHYIIDASLKSQKEAEYYLFSAQIIQKIPCLLPNQPFVSILTKGGGLYEAQFFSKLFVELMTIDMRNKTVTVIKDKIPIVKRRSDFNGQKVVSTKDEPFPFFFKFLGNDSYGGFYGEMGMAIRASLNISWNFIDDDFDYGRKVNGTWIGRMGMLANNEIDLILGDVTHLQSRMEVMTPGFTDRYDDVYFYFKKLGSGSASTGDSFLKVFDKPLWMAILAAVIISSTYLTLALRSIGNKAEASISILASATIVLRSYAYVGYDIPSTSSKGQRSHSLTLWLVSVSFCGMVIFLAYNACLVSFLSIKIIPRRFTSFEDVKNFPNYKIALDEKSIPAQIMRSETNNRDWEMIYKNNIAPHFPDVNGDYLPKIIETLVHSNDGNVGTIVPDIIMALIGNDITYRCFKNIPTKKCCSICN